jgi:hypothetical protein
LSSRQEIDRMLPILLGHELRRKLIILVGAAAVLSAVWTFWISPTYTIGYRTTIVVAVEDRVINASGVCETQYPFIVRFADLNDPNSIHDGEPVEFDRPAYLAMETWHEIDWGNRSSRFERILAV